MTAEERCHLCNGYACAEGCFPRCQHKWDGPDAHPVCRRCGGSGNEPTPPEDTPQADREPQPSDGPDCHADHEAWVIRQERAHRPTPQADKGGEPT